MNPARNRSLLVLAGLLLVSRSCGVALTPDPEPTTEVAAIASTVGVTATQVQDLPTESAPAPTVEPTDPVPTWTAQPTGTEPLPTVVPTEPTATRTSVATQPTAPPTVEPPTGTLASTEANADVLHVRAVETGEGVWTFHVTVEHPDTGWEDYADGWDVVLSDGTVLKPDPDSPFTRLLLHPHVGEQPFTRSQSGILIPAGTTQVRVRAHDLVHGFGGREIVVDLVASGEDFEVERKP